MDKSDISVTMLLPVGTCSCEGELHDWVTFPAGIAASLLITVLRYTAGVLTEWYGISRHRIRVVHKGNQPKDLAQEKHRKTSGQRIILFLGWVTGQKGPYSFIAAAEKVLDRFKNGVIMKVA
jgi:glycosyltransferase involved in cell wall biosynthesis